MHEPYARANESDHRVLVQRAHSLLQGVIVALLTAGAIELASAFLGRLETPPPVLAIPVIFAAYLGGTRAGLVCAFTLVAYTAVGWKNAGQNWSYTDEMEVRLGMLAIGLPVGALLVGYLKDRSEARFVKLEKSERKLRELHADLSHVLASRGRILDQSMDIICTANAAGQFTMMSAACERILGFKSEELVGRRFMDFVHPDDHERTTLIATKIVSGLHTVDFINRYYRKDGSLVHLMWSSRWCPVDQLMYAVARDYTEQKTVDDERARYVSIIEATSDLVGMSWCDGRVSYLNRAGRELLGIGEDEDVTTLYVTELYSDRAAELLLRCATDEALDNGVWSGETALQSRNGTKIPVSQIILGHRRPEGPVEFLSTIARDISTIKALEARLREEAATDDLTGLFNRKHFMERFDAALHSARRRGHLLSFALCDLDGFKLINDRHGHLVGDQVLRAVGIILSAEVRGEDLVCRYGGDEFCIMFPHVSAKDALVCLERVRRRISELVFQTPDGVIGVTITAGVVDLDGANVTQDLLIEAADQALYRAKSAGRNRIEVGSPAASVSR